MPAVYAAYGPVPRASAQSTLSRLRVLQARHDRSKVAGISRSCSYRYEAASADPLFRSVSRMARDTIAQKLK